MGTAILLILAVYGIGALLGALFGWVFGRGCVNCPCTIQVQLNRDNCEGVMRQLLYQLDRNRLPAATLHLMLSDSETEEIVTRLCQGRTGIILEESTNELRTGHGSGDGNHFFQPRKRFYRLRN